MAYTTLMVQLEAGHANAAVLLAAGDLAERFQAHVVGIAVCRPMQMVYGEAYLSGELIAQEKTEMQAEVDAAEAEFRGALEGRAASMEWRSMVMFAPMADFVVHEARCADLLITARGIKDSLDPSRGVPVGDLIMQLGRPIFVVPPVLEDHSLDRVVVGWTDSREARRAVVDAMPLLQKAAHVVVAEMAADADFADAHRRLADVVQWLRRHGVVARSLVVLSSGDDAAGLDAIAEEQGAGVIVAGAYGHSRLREWAMGGVTRKLLQHADRYLLVSH
ncbi:universal stress protein [Rhodoferax sp. WC2427]|uniref:universal stress protein n=1 Tax=Rhodoferax sp. WC2427 TaxID=3234144 RepID=UPI003464F75F